MKKLVIAAVAALSTLLVGCTVNVGGSPVPEGAVEVPQVQAEAPETVPETTVPPAPPQTLREKLVAIPGMTPYMADTAVELINSDPGYVEAILEGCEMGLTSEFFVNTAMEGATEDGPLDEEAMVILPQVFETIWTHYCVNSL